LRTGMTEIIQKHSCRKRDAKGTPRSSLSLPLDTK
jgi:hypothetical protein